MGTKFTRYSLDELRKKLKATDRHIVHINNRIRSGARRDDYEMLRIACERKKSLEVAISEREDQLWLMF